jgi:hypothetical protein
LGTAVTAGGGPPREFRASTITAQASALDLLTTQIPALARPASP